MTEAANLLEPVRHAVDVALPAEARGNCARGWVVVLSCLAEAAAKPG
jgi:hypothetical protein